MKKDKLENISIEVSELEERIIELEYQIEEFKECFKEFRDQYIYIDRVSIRLEELENSLMENGLFKFNRTEKRKEFKIEDNNLPF